MGRHDIGHCLVRVGMSVAVGESEAVEAKHLSATIIGWNHHCVWRVDAGSVRHAQDIGSSVSVSVREIGWVQGLKESLTQEVFVE